MFDIFRVRTAAVASVALLVAPQAGAADLPATDIGKKCEPAIQNRSCYVEYESGKTHALPALRVNSAAGTTVEIRVVRNPFGKVAFDDSTALELDPDVAWAVLKQLLDPLKALVISTDVRFASSADCAAAGRDQDLCEIIVAVVSQTGAVRE